jgi:hypothetical protein
MVPSSTDLTMPFVDDAAGAGSIPAPVRGPFAAPNWGFRRVGHAHASLQDVEHPSSQRNPRGRWHGTNLRQLPVAWQ